jgi:hypothetical protein
VSHSDAENLARLRVARETGLLPPDLGEWALISLIELLPAATRIRERNRLLCAAASHLTGSDWSKAKRLRSEVEAQSRRGGAVPVAEPVAMLVAQALAVDPGMPTSERTFWQLLKNSP